MTDDQIRNFIETVGPVIDAVFPEWSKGKREMLVARLVEVAIVTEEGQSNG